MANLIPSFSNTAGTGGGALAALAVALLAKAGYLAAAAAAIGLPEATVTTMAITGIGLLANYAITHFAEVKNLNDLVATWWPQVVSSYPDDKTGQVAQGQSNANINKV